MFERVRQGAVDLIRGDLALCADQVNGVAQLMEECLQDGQPYAVMNLEKVPLIDSAGLELLVDCRERFEQLGGTLKLAAPSPLCEEILSVTGVAEGFEIFEEASLAVGSFVR
jgi:anti-anti-sigma factor